MSTTATTITGSTIKSSLGIGIHILTRRTVEAAVRAEYDQASEAFPKTCNGASWARLETCMYALQAIRSFDDDETNRLLRRTPLHEYIFRLREYLLAPTDRRKEMLAE